MLAMLCVPAMANSWHECTTFIITPGASANGSMYVGHSNDGYGPCVTGHNVTEDDLKLVYVPAADHPPGSKRVVHYDPNSGSDEPTKTASGNAEVAYIDEVNHTYGYITGTYGIINEHQLMSGECTDYTKIQPNWDSENRIFYSAELSNIAMERCINSSDAVRLVGSLIDTYGYYGTGETLLFADPKEAWVIEMCGGTLDNRSGLWVAQRVPEGDVFVATNCFRIRDVNPNDPNMIYSSNLFDVAKARGWWKPEDGTLDWLKTVSTGEYSHPYYSLARLWSVYNRIASSKNFSPYVNDTWSRDYPFSLKPDRKLTTKDALNLFRDHYEGTVYDLTRGMAAGPYGNPYRNDGPFDAHQAFEPGEIKPGAWPRPVSPIFCGYSYVTQGRSGLADPLGGLCWFGYAQPYETCYIPFYSGVTSLPVEFNYGNRTVFDRKCAWWAFNFVTNWATLRYSDMVKDIQSEQARIEGVELSNQSTVEFQAEQILKSNGTKACSQFLTDYCNNNAKAVLDDWWNLADILIVKYSNCMINDFQNNTTIRAGYPNWWLNETGYQYGPRIYQYAELQNITGVKYVNETAYTEPGNELNYIEENQR
jgi:dipeptidase